jgi:hypothetical protein
MVRGEGTLSGDLANRKKWWRYAEREMAAEVKGSLGFGLSPLFIGAGVNWTLMFHSTLLEITGCIG